MIKDIRGAAQLLRRRGAGSVADVDTGAGRDPVRWFLRFTADRAALARSDPETERGKTSGTCACSAPSDGCPSSAAPRTAARPADRSPSRGSNTLAQAWAADALVSMTAGPVRAVVAAVGLLSEHLSRRADAGPRPDALSHRDIHAFLARLAHLERAGVLVGGSADAQPRPSRPVPSRLSGDGPDRHPAVCSRPLPDDIVVRSGERPRARRRDDEAGRALPEVVIGSYCPRRIFTC